MKLTFTSTVSVTPWTESILFLDLREVDWSFSLSPSQYCYHMECFLSDFLPQGALTLDISRLHFLLPRQNTEIYQQHSSHFSLLVLLRIPRCFPWLASSARNQTTRSTTVFWQSFSSLPASLSSGCLEPTSLFVLFPRTLFRVK